jgi:predicted ATPase
MLRRLAVLADAPTLDVAEAIASGPDIDAADFDDDVANLVAKPFIIADVGGAVVQHKLLDTTRAYALAKLKESGESD